MSTIGGPSPKSSAFPTPAAAPTAPTAATPAAEPAKTTAPTAQEAPAAAPSTPTAKPTAETAKDASLKFQTDAGASAIKGKLAPKADSAASTAATLGAAPTARPAASNFTDVAKAKAAVEKDFGVKVKDGDKPWTAEELSRVHESFSKMPAADQEKLKGLDLIRDAKAPPESQAEMKSGTVAGEYSPNVTTTNGARDKPGSISLYDAAFPPGNTADSRQATQHVILHEAGHAVEGRARDDAMATSNAAVDKSNAAAIKLNDTIPANNASVTAYNQSVGATNGVKPRSKELGDFQAAQNGVTSALGKMGSATTAADVAKAQTDLDAAKTKRDAALAKLPAGAKGRAEADAQVAAGNDWEKTARATGDARAAYTPLAQDSKDKKAALGKLNNAKNESSELQAFNKATAGEKQVSTYGATKPAENYAESYALYKRDPEYVKANFPKRYEFFHKNHP